MIKLDIEDFIFEVKDEMSCYEEIGAEGADLWEEGFRNWLKEGKNQENVIKKGDKIMFALGDESEIFDIADEYLNAVENNRVSEYWKKFK